MKKEIYFYQNSFGLEEFDKILKENSDFKKVQNGTYYSDKEKTLAIYSSDKDTGRINFFGSAKIISDLEEKIFNSKIKLLMK